MGAKRGEGDGALQKVVLVTTGGTIAMSKDSEGVVPTVDGNRHVARLEGLERLALVESLEFSNIPSPYMTPQTMWGLSRVIQRLVDQVDVGGVVVTHGTDTLEETAYFLDLTVRTSKPIVLTAAMRNINELGTDGPRNVFSSVRVAICPQAVDAGAVVCLNDEIHAAREVTKTYTSNVATFESPGFGPLGIVDEDGVFFFRKSLTRSTLHVERIEPAVALLKTFTGDDGTFLDHALQVGFKGIVLEGFGRGNVPSSLVESISRCIAKGVPLVLVSRCYKGRVLDIYGYEGGGASLKQMGVIIAHEQTGQKARIKLMALMGMTTELEVIRSCFESSEQSPMRREI